MDVWKEPIKYSVLLQFCSVILRHSEKTAQQRQNRNASDGSCISVSKYHLLLVGDLLPLSCHKWRNNILFSSHGKKDKTLNLELFLSHRVKTSVRIRPGYYAENLSFFPSLSQHTSSSSSLSDSSAGCVQIGPLREASRARSRSVRLGARQGLYKRPRHDSELRLPPGGRAAEQQ